MNPSVRQIFVFLVLLCLFSAIADALIVHMHQGNLMTSRFIMCCPAVAALATCAIFRLDLSTLGWRRPSGRWFALSYCLPVLYAFPVYLFAWLAVPHSFALKVFEAATASSYDLARRPIFGTFGVGVPLLLTVGMIATITWALGEELGWRGFLLPRLVSCLGFTRGCLVSGLIWAVWHYPDLLWGDYNAGTNPRFATACFTLMVIAMAFPLGWLRLRTRSVWPCALLHASHNVFIQGIFDALTANVGRERYITTEFGAGLVLTLGATALYFWGRRAEVRITPEAA